MKTIILITFLLAACLQSTEASNLILIEFDTDNYDSTLAHLERLESKGVTPRHIFAPNWVIADIHQLPAELAILGGGKDLHAGQPS